MIFSLCFDEMALVNLQNYYSFAVDKVLLKKVTTTVLLFLIKFLRVL